MLNDINNIFFLSKLKLSEFVLLVLISLILVLFELLGLGILQSFLILFLQNDFITENLFLKLIIDFFSNNFKNNIFFSMVIFFIIFFIIKNIFAIFLKHVHYKILEKTHNNLSNNFLKKFTSLTHNDIKKNKSTYYNQVYSRYIPNFNKNILGSLISIFTDAIFIVLVLIYLSTINFKLVLFSLSLITFIILSNLMITKNFLKKNSERINVTEETIKFKITEFINNFREIYLYNLNNKFFDILINFSKNWIMFERKFLFLTSINKFFYEIVILIFLTFYIMFIFDFNAAVYELSTIMVFGYATIRILPLLSGVNHYLNQFNQHRYDLATLTDFFKNKNFDSEIDKYYKKDYSDKKVNTIILKDLEFYYHKNSYLFKSLNIKCKYNEIVLIKGKSGSGKTSLIDIISSVLKPTNGQIKYLDSNGIEIFNRNDFAYVGQQPNLFNENLRFNLTLGKNLSDNMILDIIDKIDLNLNTYADNILDYIIEENGSNLSGGQKQKISVIRAFLQNKGVIFFDEITSGLDEESEEKIINFICKNKKDKIIFYISHKKFEFADKIIDLDHITK